LIYLSGLLAAILPLSTSIVDVIHENKAWNISVIHVSLSRLNLPKKCGEIPNPLIVMLAIELIDTQSVGLLEKTS
jgi:hypothetical protein